MVMISPYNLTENNGILLLIKLKKFYNKYRSNLLKII